MLTMTDLFCGAGGSSTGAIAVPGVSVTMAANHWALAIETHNANHVDTRHDCADISQVDPRRYPTTDILWASPECTNHSQARGKKRVDSTPDLFGEVLPDAASERSRATMWDVPRFAERHRYRAVIIENVVDAWHWEPFPAWLMAMDSLGYEHDLVFMNSMHAQAGGLPAPQSRDRMYVVFWRKGGRRPDLERWTRPSALCPACGPIQAMQAWKRNDRPKWGRYRAQYVWRCPNVRCRNQVVEPGWLPAAAAIDWKLDGQRIGDRDRPLAPKTMARIEAGLRKYADAFLTVHRYEYRTAPLSRPSPTVAASGNHLGLLVPAGGTWNESASPTDLPMRARTARENEALLVPVEGRDGKEARPSQEPMRTMTTRNETAFVVPLRAHNTPKATREPFDTFAANGNHHALVMRNNTARGNPAQMTTPVDEVLRTLTTSGHQSLIAWDHLVYDYNGPIRTPGEPLATATTVEGEALLGTAIDPMDCLFRMLEPSEIAAGMAFPASYVIKGNRRERVRQAGNAVCPPNARDLISAVAESFEPI